MIKKNQKLNKVKLLEYLIIGFILLGIALLIILKNTNYIDYFSVSIVDDMIHDKYEKNTLEYYNYRINRDEKLLEGNSGSLILYDNLAVAYDHIGNLEKALLIYKTKKSIMDTNEFDMQNRYRYYANLGTFLIHNGINGWFKDKSNKKSQDLVLEGRDYIKKAIEININAHFGRENYQLIANNWIISSFNNQSLMISENMLGKTTLDFGLLSSENSWGTCGKVYHDIYPETKKVGKNLNEQIQDSCPMALKGVIGMIRFGGGPNPFSFVTIGDILTSMGEYKLAFASYARAIDMKHPNSDKIKIYSMELAKKIYPKLSKQESYEKLLNQFKKDYKLGKEWSDKYTDYQKNIILQGKDPTQIESYNGFYNKFKHPIDVKYSR